MDKEQVMLRLFELKHGKITNSQIVKDEYTEEPVGVGYYKHGQMCWMESSTDLLLWFVGQQFKPEAG